MGVEIHSSCVRNGADSKHQQLFWSGQPKSHLSVSLMLPKAASLQSLSKECRLWVPTSLGYMEVPDPEWQITYSVLDPRAPGPVLEVVTGHRMNGGLHKENWREISTRG